MFNFKLQKGSTNLILIFAGIVTLAIFASVTAFGFRAPKTSRPLEYVTENLCKTNPDAPSCKRSVSPIPRTLTCYDVPTPALGSTTNPFASKKDGKVTEDDVTAVRYYFGTQKDGPPNGNGVDYDSDLNQNTTLDGKEYDLNEDGAVSIVDVVLVSNQVGTSCQSTSPTPSPIEFPTTLPAAPSEVSAQVQCPGVAGSDNLIVIIKWRDNSNNEIGFKIAQRKSSENNFTEIVILSSQDALDGQYGYYKWYGAQFNTKYVIGVGAYNNAGVNWAYFDNLNTSCPSPTPTPSPKPQS